MLKHSEANKRWLERNPDWLTQWRKKNREKLAAVSREYRRLHGSEMYYHRKNREGGYEIVPFGERIFHSAQQRAKKAGLLFTLKRADVVVPKTCPVLGIPLFKGTRKNKENAPSLDRLNPKLGYVPGNVHVISYKANRLKSNATAAELCAVVRYIRANS